MSDEFVSRAEVKRYVRSRAAVLRDELLDVANGPLSYEIFNQLFEDLSEKQGSWLLVEIMNGNAHASNLRLANRESVCLDCGGDGEKYERYADGIVRCAMCDGRGTLPKNR